MEGQIIISQEKRSITHLVFAAFFYTVTIFLIGWFLWEFKLSLERNYALREVNKLEIAIFSLSAAIYYSVIHTFYFDFDKKLFKKERKYVFVKLGKWQELPALEYISVFKKEASFYEINLWNVGNKHFKISHAEEKEEALAIGKELAKKLKIDLLDATVANDSKWIEL